MIDSADQRAADRYLAERNLRELLEERRERRWERRRHVLGFWLVWAAAELLAFSIGYSMVHAVHVTAVIIGGGVIVGLFCGGRLLKNGHRRRPRRKMDQGS